MTHRQEHAVSSTSDHTDTGFTPGNLVAYDANGLPAADGGDPATLITMQAVYDNAEAIAFDKNMTWDLNAAYDFILQEGTDSVSVEATAANTLHFAAQVGSIDFDAASSVSIDAANGGTVEIAGGTFTSNVNIGTKGTRASVAIGHAGVTEVSLDAVGLSLDATATSNITVTSDSVSTETLLLRAVNTGAGIGRIQLRANNAAGDEVVVDGSIVDINAITVYVDATGAVSVDAVTTSNFTVTGNSASTEILELAVTNAGAGTARLILSSEDNISMTAVNVLVEGTGSITADAPAISLDATDTSNFTMTANSSSDKNLSIRAINSGAGFGHLTIFADDIMDVGATNFDLDATIIALDSTYTSNFTMTANDASDRTLTIEAINNGAGAGNLVLDADDEVEINTTLFDVNVGSATLDATKEISLDATEDSNFTLAGAGTFDRTLTISVTHAGAGDAILALASDDLVDIDATTVDVDATGAILLGCTTDSNFTLAGSSAVTETLLLRATNGGVGGNAVIQLRANNDADDGVVIDAAILDINAASYTLDTSGDTTFTIGGSFSATAVDDSQLRMNANSASDRRLTIRATNSNTGDGELALIADDQINASSAEINLDATGAISLDSADNSNITMTTDSPSTKILTIEAVNINKSAFIDMNGSAGIRMYRNSIDFLSIISGGVVVNNDNNNEIDFTCKSENKDNLFHVESTGNGIVAIDGDALSVTGYADAPLNITDHTWLLGGTVYDLDFSGTVYDTPAECRDVGLAMSNESGHPSVVDYIATDLGSLSHVLDWTHSAGNGWRASWGSAQAEVATIAWPLNRNDNWQLMVDFTSVIPPTNADEVSLILGTLCGGAQTAYYARIKVINSIVNTGYRAQIRTNDGDNVAFTRQYLGTSVTSGGGYKMGLRCWNGVISVYDDQDSAWHDYTGTFGGGSFTSNAAFGVQQVFVGIGNATDAAALACITIDNIKFEYLK